MTRELDDCIGQELNITKSYGLATSEIEEVVEGSDVGRAIHQRRTEFGSAHCDDQNQACEHGSNKS